jgi:site-specific DNA-methyltransferase (adenine-specific)
MQKSKEQIIWGGNYFPLPPTRCVIAWDKVQPWENFSQIELAWTSFDSPAQLFRYDNRTGDKIHPTQKPIALYNYQFHKYGRHDMKIIDTHLGSMSIVLAAIDYLDLDTAEFIGTEIDREYFDKGVARIEAHLAKPKLDFMKPQPIVEQANLF